MLLISYSRPCITIEFSGAYTPMSSENTSFIDWIFIAVLGNQGLEITEETWGSCWSDRDLC